MADVWVRLPLGALMNGTVRQLVERPSSNLGACGFNSHLCHFRPGAGNCLGRAVGRQAACKAAALMGNVGSIPTRGTGGSFFQRPGYQVVNLAMRVQFPYEPLLMCPCEMARSSNGSGRQVLNL
jgi:hypothetical protein